MQIASPPATKRRLRLGEVYSVRLRAMRATIDRRRQRGEARPDVGNDIAAVGSLIEAMRSGMHGRTETFCHARVQTHGGAGGKVRCASRWCVVSLRFR